MKRRASGRLARLRGEVESKNQSQKKCKTVQQSSHAEVSGVRCLISVLTPSVHLTHISFKDIGEKNLNEVLMFLPLMPQLESITGAELYAGLLETALGTMKLPNMKELKTLRFHLVTDENNEGGHLDCSGYKGVTVC
eukprot:628187_1